MFAKDKVSQSLVDAVKGITEANWEKEKTPTGTRVYGSSYGNSAKAKKDQTKHELDTIKGPKDKEVKEELKGDQHKIDANKNNKIDAQDFAILRGKKKVKEDMHFANKLLEVAKADIPAYLRKQKGEKPLTVADVKGPRTDSISSKEALAKARNEEVEQIEEREMSDDEMAKREKIVKSMKKGFAGFRKRYGERAKDVMYATATKQAMKEESVEEEIDPKVRTKDTIKGRKPSSQTDDVGPGSDSKSTKVKYHPGPMEEETEQLDEIQVHFARGNTTVPKSDKLSPAMQDTLQRRLDAQRKAAAERAKMKESTDVPFEGPYSKEKDTVTDKSGAKHTPMSRARDLARAALKKVQDKTKVKTEGKGKW